MMLGRLACSCSLIGFALLACGGNIDRGEVKKVDPVDANGERRTTSDETPPPPPPPTTTIGVSAPVSCVLDTDCAAGFIGDVCECECTVAPIAARDLEAHQARIEALRAQCKEKKQCGPCQGYRAVCEAGACKILPY
jgi:hypothetical protein